MLIENHNNSHSALKNHTEDARRAAETKLTDTFTTFRATGQVLKPIALTICTKLYDFGKLYHRSHPEDDYDPFTEILRSYYVQEIPVERGSSWRIQLALQNVELFDEFHLPEDSPPILKTVLLLSKIAQSWHYERIDPQRKNDIAAMYLHIATAAYAASDISYGQLAAAEFLEWRGYNLLKQNSRSLNNAEAWRRILDTSSGIPHSIAAAVLKFE